MAARGTAVVGAAGLRCRGVVVRPGGHAVLDGVDLEVTAGSLTTLTGPSGVGKTTLLRAIAGLEEPDEGTIRLGGRDLGPLPTHQRGIAYVFQRPRLFPHLNVLDNVAFPLRMRGVGDRERRARSRALLAEVGLAGFEQRMPRRLSGGEAQRVSLARALVGEPDLLLLDEPLASVDADLRRSLRALLRRLLADRPTTAVYVTHDQAEAAELGDRVAVMLAGRIAQVGPPKALFERPRNIEVARFFGAENVIEGRVEAGRLRFGEGSLPVPGPDGHATFVIRPERVRLVDPDAVGLRGTVEDRRYLGTHERVRIRVGDRVLEADLPTGSTPPEGATVGVDLPEERLWRLPGTGSATTRTEPLGATS